MANIVCPMCGDVVYVPDGKNFVICPKCSLVIYTPDETHDRKDEESFGDS